MNKDTLTALDRIGAERRARIIGKPVDEEEFGPKATVPNEPSLFKQMGQATGEVAQSVPAIHEEGNAFDFAGATLWGAASGLSWGTTGFVEPDKYNWQEMNSASRAGWVVGEGLSLFAPWGPFGLMGKATAAGGKAITKGALRTVADQTVKRTIGKEGTAVTAKTIKKIAEKTGKSYDEVLEATTGSVRKELSEAATDDYAIQWLRGIESKGAEAANSEKLLSDMAGNAVKTAFKESKIDIADAQVDVIRKAFMEGLREGKYVNDVGEWLGKKLGGQAPGLPRELVSKYLGMAATDLTMMSAHGLIHGKMREMSKGEHFDVGETLSHSFMMALAFPLIRAVPGGGRESFQTGIKGYMSRYAKSDYNAIAEKHGSEVVRNLARIMYSKPRLHPLNHNRLAGKQVMGFEKGSDVLKALDKVDDAGKYVFKDSDVIKLMDVTKRNVSQNLVSDWSGKYAFDFVKSIPRIGIGVAAMNPWVFEKGSWGQMDSSELGAHLFISAMMVKGKGGWGHKEQHAAQADYSKHFEAMRIFGAKEKDITGIINYYNSGSVIAGMGGTFYSHHAGRKLFEGFDEIVEGYDPKASKGTGYNKTRDAKTEKYFLWWQMMKSFTQEGGQPPDMDFQSLDRKTLNKFEAKLKDIKLFEDASLHDVDYEKALVTVTEETAQVGLGVHEQLLLDFGSVFGYDVSKEGDQPLRISKSKSKNKDIGIFSDVNHLIEILDSYGLIKMSSEDGRTIEQLLNEKDASGNRKFETIEDMQVTAESMIGGMIDKLNQQFGSRDIIHELTDNPYLEFLGHASEIVANDRMYHIITGKVEDGKKWSENDKIMLKTLDSIFGVTSSKDSKTGYLNSIADYVTHIIANEKGGSKFKLEYDKADESGKRQIRQGIEEQLQGLTKLFELRKMNSDEINIIHGPIKGTSNATREGIETLTEKYTKFKGELPKEWEGKMFPQVKASYWERKLNSSIVDQRAFGLITMGVEAGIFRVEKGKIKVPTKEAWIKAITGAKTLETDSNSIAEVEASLRQIEKVLGKDLVESSDWTPAVEGKDAVDINILKDMTAWLGSVQLENIQSARKTLGDIISGKDKNKNGVLNRLASLQSGLSLVESALAGTSGSVKDVVGKITDIRDTLDNLKGTLTKEENAGIEFALNMLDKSLKDAAPADAADVVMSTVDKGTVEGMIKMLEPIQNTILEAVTGEVQSLQRPIEIMAKLESLALKSTSMMGLTPVQALDMTDKLIAEWYKKYEIADRAADKISIEELIEKVNTEGSFRDFEQVWNEISQGINQQIFIASKFSRINDIGAKLAETIFDGNQIHSHKRTGLEIARDYGLVNERGQINEDFKSRLTSTEDIYQVLHDVIRGQPEKTLPDGTKQAGFGIMGDTENYTSNNQRRLAWQEFRSRDGMELILGLTNADPYNSVSLQGHDPKGISTLLFDPNKSSSRSPNQRYYKDNNFQVAFLEDKMTAQVGGKLQSFSMDFFAGGPDKLTGAEAIQFVIDNSFRSTDSEVLIRQFNEMGFKITDKMVSDAQGGVIQHPLLYMRLSPNDRILFAVTKDNLRILDKTYQDWYDEAQTWFTDTNQLRKFQNIFGGLTEAEHSYSTTDINTTSRHIAELKMLMPYLTTMGKRQQIKQFIEEAVAGNVPAMSKIQADLFKRGYLSDGGTTQVVNNKALKWFSKGHFSKSPVFQDIRDQADKVLEEGWDGLVVNDEAFAPQVTNGAGFAMDIRNVSWNNLQIISDNATNRGHGVLSDIATFMQSKVKNNEYGSLKNSLLDGAKFFTERGMRLLLAASGNLDVRQGVNGRFNRGAPNGQKTIIFATGEGNQMLGKGYAVYHPDIAQHIPAGVDFVIGESSAKSYDGVSRLGGKIQTFDLAGTQRRQDGTFDWSYLSNSTTAHIMNLNSESMGVSFASKNANGVTMPASIVDMNSSEAVQDWLRVVNIDQEVNSLALDKKQLFSGESLSQYLYRMNEQHGNMIEHGEAGLAKLILGWGASSDDPIVHGSLIRLARKGAFDIIGKSSVMHGGEDNYITPNVLGDLGNPVYADILGTKRFGPKGISDRLSPQIKSRSVARFGGIGLNRNTMKRTIGVHTDRDTPTLNGEQFVISDNNGIDWIVNVRDILSGKTNDALQFHSPLYRKGGRIAARDRNTETLDVNSKDGTINGVVGLTQADRREIYDLLREVHHLGTTPITDASGRVTQEGFRLRDVFRLLNYAKTGSNQDRPYTKRLGTLGLARAIKFDMQLASVGHAVPVIAFDKPIFRVQKLLQDMNGLVEINSFDLRTLLQRDNDGDHFYTHNKMPWSITKEFSDQLGLKEDFNIWNKVNSLKDGYINIFGIGQNGTAGEIAHETGFQNYANKIQKNNMIIGTVIGARGALTWLNRMGLTHKEQPSKRYPMEPYIKDLTKFDDYINQPDTWSFLDKYLDGIQNSVDKFGGTHQVMERLFDFIFFGEAGHDKPLDNDPHYNRHMKSPESIFHNDGNKTSPIQKEIFKTILRTVKKANLVSNDTFDEGGGRTPEAFELRDARNELMGFFANPTRFIQNKLISRIGWMRNSGQDTKIKEADGLLAEYLELFYGDKAHEFSNKDRRQTMYWNIMKTGFDSDVTKQIFGFETSKIRSNKPAGEGRYGDYWSKSVNGSKLRKMTSLELFQDDFHFGKEFHQDDLQKAGIFVKGIEQFINTAHAFGNDPQEIVRDLMTDKGIKVFKSGTFGAKFISDGIKTSMLRDIVSKQYESVMSQIRFLEADRFSNSERINRGFDRLLNLQEAMDAIDYQESRGMKWDANIWHIKQEGKYEFNDLGKKQKVDVYRYNGDIKATKGETLSDSGINLNQLEFVGRFKKGDRLYQQKGWSYLRNNSPKQRVSMSNLEVAHGEAWNKVTRASYKDDGSGISWDAAVPKGFLKNPDEINIFLSEVMELRGDINHGWSSTVQSVRDKRIKALKNRIYNTNSEREVVRFQQFMEKWMPAVNDEGELWRYIVAPRYSQAQVTYDNNGNAIPVFKVNKHLLTTAMNWAIEPNVGKAAMIEELVGQVRHIMDHPNGEVDFSAWESSHYDNSAFNFEALGANSTPFVSMSKAMGHWYADPMVMRLIRDVGQPFANREQTLHPVGVEGFPGSKVRMIKHPSGKPSTYMEIHGRICG